ncbi:MAG TPA: hypothetical protein VG733_09760 [Chthoniobacteraceae bacterium]|nr:hypothetical protein [Chthoniobacteraceae bacterium]
MNATSKRLFERPGGRAARSLSLVPLPANISRSPRSFPCVTVIPGDWFEMSQLHEEFWLKARPILEEIKRLRDRYGKVEARDDGRVLVCPPHVDWSIRHYEESLERIRRGIFRGCQDTGAAGTGGPFAGENPGFDKQTLHPRQCQIEDYEPGQKAA